MEQSVEVTDREMTDGEMVNREPADRETKEESKVTRKRGLSGSTLKIIAVVTMLIDHIGAIVGARLLMAAGYMEIATSSDVYAINAWLIENATLYRGYTILRMIGRVAFPIFCFLLVEGFTKTRDVRKYAMRLGIFALISEIPFDLALKSTVLEFDYQNVYFTLFVGLLTMIACNWTDKQEWHIVIRRILRLPIVAAGAALAEFMNTDYGAIGVLCIMVLFFMREKKVWKIATGCLVFLWEVTAPLAFIPIGFYNGQRGLKLKYFFYAFYPIHLLILYLICVGMGISGYPAV